MPRSSRQTLSGPPSSHTPIKELGLIPPDSLQPAMGGKQEWNEKVWGEGERSSVGKTEMETWLVSTGERRP